MSHLTKIQKETAPQHVAIIMDGNGRWAEQQGKDRVFGHQNGAESVRNAIKAALQSGVRYLTLYTFSAENWQRPEEEVRALMQLLVELLVLESPKLNAECVRLGVIGQTHLLPESVQEKLHEALALTQYNDKLHLILALSYSARNEILQAVKSIAEAVAEKAINPADITEEMFAQNLSTVGIPDPDLLIRTSGEIRISNFLLWQMAYTEFYFTPVLWPSFTQEDFFEAILAYQHRQRRFGKTQQQI
jgi:undecaprenyl diphosphate synthase